MICPAAKPAALLGWPLRTSWPPMKKLPSSCSSIGPPSDAAVAAETPSARLAAPITTPSAKTEASCRIMFCMSFSLGLGQFLPYHAQPVLCRKLKPFLSQLGSSSAMHARDRRGRYTPAGRRIAAAESWQLGAFYADQFRMSCKNHSVGISRPKPARRAAS
jgi:hypothetical protein